MKVILSNGKKVEIKCETCKIADDCDIYQSWLNTRDCCCPKLEGDIGYTIAPAKSSLGFAGDQNAPIPIYKEDNPLYKDSVGGETDNALEDNR